MNCGICGQRIDGSKPETFEDVEGKFLAHVKCVDEELTERSMEEEKTTERPEKA